MNIGMLWHDGDKKTELADRIEKAAQYYERKYGRKPTMCFVNPRTLEDGCQVDGIQVKADQQVLPNDLFLGVKEM